MQFKNENDVTPSVINMNRSRFPILLSVLKYNIHEPEYSADFHHHPKSDFALKYW